MKLPTFSHSNQGKSTNILQVESCDSSVTIVTRLEVGRPKNCGSICGTNARFFPPPPPEHPGHLWSQVALYTGACFHWGKVTRI